MDVNVRWKCLHLCTYRCFSHTAPQWWEESELHPFFPPSSWSHHAVCYRRPVELNTGFVLTLKLILSLSLKTKTTESRTEVKKSFYTYGIFHINVKATVMPTGHTVVSEYSANRQKENTSTDQVFLLFNWQKYQYTDCDHAERLCLSMRVCECVCVPVPVMVLSGGDSEGVSVSSRPQQHVSLLGLSLKQQLGLQTGHTVVTTAGSRETQRSAYEQSISSKAEFTYRALEQSMLNEDNCCMFTDW